MGHTSMNSRKYGHRVVTVVVRSTGPLPCEFLWPQILQRCRVRRFHWRLELAHLARRKTSTESVNLRNGLLTGQLTWICGQVPSSRSHSKLDGFWGRSAQGNNRLPCPAG